MIEIILAIITGVLTIISTLLGAKAIENSNCTSNCCDFVLEAEPRQE